MKRDKKRNKMVCLSEERCIARVSQKKCLCKTKTSKSCGHREREH